MKKLLFLLGMPLALVGCQDEAILSDSIANGDGNISITISTDDVLASRSTSNRSSAAGGLTNVDFTNYDLRYQLGIYAAETTSTDDGDVTTYTQVIAPQTRTVSNPQAVTYSFNLTPGKQYVAVAWADFVTAGSQADLHYDTSDFTNITCLDDDDARLNDESRDAYAVSQSFEVGNDALNLDLTLKRLFAKLRIVTTDWNLEGVDKPNKVELTYDNCYEGLSLNIINTSKTYTTSTRTYTVDLAEEKDYQLNYDAADCNRTLAVDYLIAAGNGYAYSNFTLKAYKDETLLTTKAVDTDIPLRSNWLTTVLGNLMSTNSQITVQCDEMFENENNRVISGSDVTASEPESADNVYYVSNAAELLWISENTSSLKNATVKLTADIDLDGIDWEPITSFTGIGDSMVNYISTFDGQNHTIYNLYINKGWVNQDYSSQSSLGLFAQASNITIKNVTLQNVSIDYGISFCGGIVGQLGSAGGTSVIENCTVNNFFFRPALYNHQVQYPALNCGAIVGIMSQGSLIDCHANNVDIENGWRAGGLVGFCNYRNISETLMTFTNCSVSHAVLWNMYESLDEEDMFRQCGALVGLAWGNGEDSSTIEFEGCSSSDITYKYLGVTATFWDSDTEYHYETLPLVTQKSGEEGTFPKVTYENIEFIYGADTPLVGRLAEVAYSVK